MARKRYFFYPTLTLGRDHNRHRSKVKSKHPRNPPRRKATEQRSRRDLVEVVELEVACGTVAVERDALGRGPRRRQRRGVELQRLPVSAAPVELVRPLHLRHRPPRAEIPAAIRGRMDRRLVWVRDLGGWIITREERRMEMMARGGGDLNVVGCLDGCGLLGFACPRPREDHGRWGLSTGNDGFAPLP